LQRATPSPILGTVHAAMMKALAAPDLKQRFFENGVTPAPMSREAFTAFIDAEMTRWVKVVKDAGATLEFSSRETQ
jgi:tripartite-type tricarboxylate transporter receptor subunit TctC